MVKLYISFYSMMQVLIINPGPVKVGHGSLKKYAKFVIATITSSPLSNKPPPIVVNMKKYENYVSFCL